MGLFSSSKSKQETTVEDRRLSAAGGAIVATEGAKLSLTSLDPKTVSESLGLAKFAIQEATRGADKIAAGFTQATTASRAAEQQLLAAAIAPDAAGAGTITNALVLIAAIAAGAFVLMRWGTR